MARIWQVLSQNTIDIIIPIVTPVKIASKESGLNTFPIAINKKSRFIYFPPIINYSLNVIKRKHIRELVLSTIN